MSFYSSRDLYLKDIQKLIDIITQLIERANNETISISESQVLQRFDINEYSLNISNIASKIYSLDLTRPEYEVILNDLISKCEAKANTELYRLLKELYVIYCDKYGVINIEMDNRISKIV